MIRVTILIILTVIIAVGCNDKSSITNTTSQLKDGKEPARLADMPEKSATSSQKITANQPPHITALDVSPLYPKVGDTLKVTLTSGDEDGDNVRLTYQWFKNDQQLSEASDTLCLANGFERGDRVTLNVIPDDGIAQGCPGRMTVTIGNASPEINSSPNDIKVINRKLTYQIKASDKDNDPLTYSLKTAPAGMTLDATTGLLQWDIPPDYKEKSTITIMVSDGHSGDAVQSFIFETASGTIPHKE
jgi:Putative Ig domain